MRQQVASQLADVKEPTEGEADVLFVVKNGEEAESVMKKIIDISKRL